MLVLTRKVGQRIRIGDEITITLVRIQGDKVRVGIEAPRDIAIHREEVRLRLDAEHHHQQPTHTEPDTGTNSGSSLLRAPDPWA